MVSKSFLYKVANAEEEEGFGNKSTSLRGRRRERNCSKRTKRSVEEKKARERNADDAFTNGMSRNHGKADIIMRMPVRNPVTVTQCLQLHG